MPKCQFKFAIELLPKFINVSKVIPKQKGNFSGDEKSGNFSIFTPIGDILGNYSCDTVFITVLITNKPVLVPCIMIERELNKLLNQPI
jgi:hypothetical protein